MAEFKISQLLENRLFYLFFLIKFGQSLRKVFEVNTLIRSNHFKKIDAISTHNYKTSNTLFVLGSGASIGQLRDEEWNLIKKHDSIGLNFWLIHDFVPTYYMFELGKDLERMKCFLKLIENRCRDYEKVPFIFKDIDNALFCQTMFSEDIKKNFYVPYRIAIPGVSEKSFIRSLEIIKILKLYKLSNYLWTKRASIVESIFFSLKLEYQEIVLCGVDLNNVEYFYESQDYADKKIPIPRKVQSGLIHKTLDPSDANYGGLTIDNILRLLNDFLLIPNGIQLFIASPNSALSPLLPVYNFLEVE